METMTKAQRYTLLIDHPAKKHISLWSLACGIAGWDAEDRAFRLAKLSEWVGRPLASSSEIGKMAEYTKVKKALEAIIFPDDMERQFDGEMMPVTNLIVSIRQKAQPALINKLLHDRFRFAYWVRQHHPQHTGCTISQKTRHPAPESVIQEYRDADPAAPLLEDLTEEELKQFRNTLDRDGDRTRRPVPEVPADMQPF